MRAHSLVARLGLALAAAVLGLTVGATGAAADPVAAATAYDLDMTATFDKPSYGTGEKMTITVTVTNNGAGPVVTRADFFRSMPDVIRIDLVNPFEQWAPFTLEAGASVTHTLTGSMPNPDVTTGTLYTWLTDETGATVPFQHTVPVDQTRGHAAGVVYYDKNRNHRFDEGEGQRGVTLTWAIQLHQEKTWTVTTDATGVFRLDVPTGTYAVMGEGLGGLLVGYTWVTVTESGVDGLQLRGTAPISGLVPKLEFTQDSYAPGEDPVVRVTMTNTSDMALSGIVATCNRAGMNTSLNGRGAGWGALGWEGVDVPPRSTLVFEVTEPMPAGSPDLGLVNVGCEFGYPEVDSTHNPHSFDRAAVPGRRGDLTGEVTAGVGGAGVAGVRVVLVPDLEYMPAPCAVVAETTTDASGTFTFHQAPVGIYMVYLFPPAGWRVEYDNPTRTDVWSTYLSRMGITLVPGDAGEMPMLPACATGGGAGGGPQPTTQQPAPPTSTTPATTARPAPQGGRVPALAHTGASIAVPGVTGLLALFAGTGLVLMSRRRRVN